MGRVPARGRASPLQYLFLNVGAWFASVSGQDAACEPGYSLASTGACEPCPAGQYGLGGTSACQDCPVGTHSSRTGASVCHCKENYYFDTVAAAAVPLARWPTLGCTDCLTVLPIEEGRVSLECPGGPTNAPFGQSLSPFEPLGPAIALSGWYLEARACYVAHGVGVPGNRTCFTRHSCADDHCLGLTDYVRKELSDLPQASLGNRTAWCVEMHEIALAEGVALDDLRLSGTTAADSKLFYQEEVSCKEHYVGAISTLRGTTSNGVKNVCYFGHDPSSRACAACLPDMKKGDDRRCHRCEGESLWLLFRGDLVTLFAYQVPLTLFLKSGRPQALKSAMFASFMFFMQTVTLLGKDSGYFLDSGFAQQEGKQIYIDTVDAISRFMSTFLMIRRPPR
eukprot:COSAG02_NODE_11667_length_1677_cov_1.510773_1_plen_394_part_10